jgi:fibronectin type 3 domain-containing protein
MRRVITKIACYTALALFMAIMFTGSSAFGLEVMDETFSKDATQDVDVVGGEFVTFDTGEEGWRAKTATEPLQDGTEPNYIEYNIEDFNHITEGTIEFWVQRNRGGGMIYKRSNQNNNPETYDTVFELLQHDNASSFSCMIMWLYAYNENESALFFNYHDYTGAKNYEPVWGVVVPMGIKPKIGDWVHIALVFGENPKEDNKVYINGVLQTRRRDLTYGKTMENGTALFSDRLSRSNRLRIGIETSWASAYPGGTSLLYHSVISNFVVHDEMLTEFDVDRFTFAGTPSDPKAEYSDGRVVLTWSGAKSDDVEGYNVYKKDAYEGDYVRINEESATELTLEDADVQEGKSYKYVVKGVNRDEVESNASDEASITIVSEFYRVTEVSREYDPRNLSAGFEDGKITITWAAPSGLAPSGYNVYKRVGEGATPFAKLTAAPVSATTYTDSDITAGNVYYYSVTALDADGHEGKYPSEIRVEASVTAISSISLDPARAVKAGDEVTVTVRGTPGKEAAFSVAGVVDNVVMTEPKSGTYYGIFEAGEGSVENAALTVSLDDVTKTAPAAVTIDNDAPSKTIGLDIRNDWENEINIDWQPATEADFKQYNIYRSTEQITETSGLSAYVVIKNKDTSEYWDGDVISNMVYYYTVASVDHAGNVSDLSDVVSAEVLADSTLPVVYKIEDNSAGVTLREGDVLEVYVEGEPESEASFNIGDVIADVPLVEDSRVGNYTGSYTVQSTDIVNDYIIVKLVERSENASTYASDYKINIDGSTKTDNTPPAIESITENSWSIAGFSGKLVGGDMLTVELIGEAGGVAYFNIGDVVEKVRMSEDEEEPGKYIGSYTIQDGDYAEQTAIAGYLADAAGNVSSITTPSEIDIDTTINIEVTPSQSVVPADKKTRIDIVAKATNLNGDEISGHKIKFTLTTTDEYTGVTGSGRYTEFEDIVGGRLRVEWRGETDAFGEVNATYKSGFAAKTTIILAKDLTSGDVGVGYIASFVSASVDITLGQHFAD